MMDYYLNDDNAVKRLIDEWKQYGKIIIGVDYDDTLFNYHQIADRTYNDVISLLKDCKKVGCYIVIFTACNETQHEDIRSYCKSINLEVDKINENMDFITFTGRKIYYNICLDDRCGLRSAYRVLNEALEHMEYERGYEKHCV